MSNIPSKRTTINDIALMAGVSKATVSYFLNGKTDKMSTATQARIQTAISATDYKPSPYARGLNAKNSKVIGVIVGDLTNSFSNQVLKGIKSIANKEGYHIVAAETDYQPEEEKSYVEEFIALGVDGFIVQPSFQFKNIVSLINHTNKPLVCFDRKLYDFSSNWIKTDNYNATFEAITEALKRGYTSFILIGAKRERLHTRLERSLGFMDALKAAHMSFTHYEPHTDKVEIKEIHAFLENYLAHHTVDAQSPTLVFAPNCWNLPIIYEALRPYFNLIPHLGLLGFDNPEWVSLAAPSVSTINQPGFAEGKSAAEVLFAQLKDPQKEIHHTLSCTIAWRNSTL